jgi:hypothetical protein
MSDSTSNKPVSEIRDGAIKIALFRNEPHAEGDRPWYSGRLTRSYRDADGKWHETDCLSGTEFLRAARLLEKAYDAELTHRSIDKQDMPSPSA